jgi:hypothetical protein
VHWVFVTVIVRVHPVGNTNLMLVIDAFCPQGLGFGTGESGQNHCRENGDDRDHYEQLDEGETFRPQRAAAGGPGAHKRGNEMSPMLSRTVPSVK